MKNIQTSEEALARLELLFRRCNDRDEALVTYIQQLALENEQLKRSLHKMRTSKSKSSAASSMHSKLTDALRE